MSTLSGWLGTYSGKSKEENETEKVRGYVKEENPTSMVRFNKNNQVGYLPRKQEMIFYYI